MSKDGVAASIARRPRAAVAAAAAVLFAAVTAAVAGAGGAPVAAGDVVQRTPNGLEVHSSLLAGHDPPHVMGAFVKASGLGATVVGAAATPSGQGWWEAASDGSVYTFGDARFFGSAATVGLSRPIVGMAATPDGGGYWLVASDGGIFTFGNAHFFGSTGALGLQRPIVGMATAKGGAGYWLVASDGGVFTFGSAAFAGAPTGATISGGATGLVPTSSGAGYWITDMAGDALGFGDAGQLGSGAGMLTSEVSAAVPSNGGALRLVGADGSSVALQAGGPTAVTASPMNVHPAAGSPTAYTFMGTNSDGAPIRWNPCAPIHYVTNLGEAPPGAAAVVAGAVARVSAATGIPFVYDGPTTEIPGAQRASYQPDVYGQRWAPVVIAWAHPSQTDVLPGGNVIGEGGSMWVEVAGGPKIYVSGEVVIDADNTGMLPPTFGAGSTLGELLMHELGHVTGLGHTSDQAQVMYPVLDPMPSASYGAGDLAGLTRLGAVNGCLTTPAP